MISISAYSEELESLKQLVNRKPLFFSDKSDTQMVATRCSALYIILSSRAEDPSNSKDLKTLSEAYINKAVVYSQARAVLSKAANMREYSRDQQKYFAKSYADMTLDNWKRYDDILKGIVNEDLNVCEDNYPYFKKLAINLSKEIKK